MKKQELIFAFRENNVLFQNFRVMLCPLLVEILISNNINYAFVRGRVKTEESLSDNFEGGLYKGKEISGLSVRTASVVYSSCG